MRPAPGQAPIAARKAATGWRSGTDTAAGTGGQGGSGNDPGDRFPAERRAASSCVSRACVPDRISRLSSSPGARWRVRPRTPSVRENGRTLTAVSRRPASTAYRPGPWMTSCKPWTGPASRRARSAACARNEPFSATGPRTMASDGCVDAFPTRPIEGEWPFGGERLPRSLSFSASARGLMRPA